MFFQVGDSSNLKCLFSFFSFRYYMAAVKPFSASMVHLPGAAMNVSSFLAVPDCPIVRSSNILQCSAFCEATYPPCVINNSVSINTRVNGSRRAVCGPSEKWDNYNLGWCRLGCGIRTANSPPFPTTITASINGTIGVPIDVAGFKSRVQSPQGRYSQSESYAGSVYNNGITVCAALVEKISSADSKLQRVACLYGNSFWTAPSSLNGASALRLCTIPGIYDGWNTKSSSSSSSSSSFSSSPSASSGSGPGTYNGCKIQEKSGYLIGSSGEIKTSGWPANASSAWACADKCKATAECTAFHYLSFSRGKPSDACYMWKRGTIGDAEPWQTEASGIRWTGSCRVTRGLRQTGGTGRTGGFDGSIDGTLNVAMHRSLASAHAYTKQSRKYCIGGTFGSYTSLSSAKTACTASSLCFGIYDNDRYCDGALGYKLCKKPNFGNSSASCVYKKMFDEAEADKAEADKAPISSNADSSGLPWSLSIATSAAAAEAAVKEIGSIPTVILITATAVIGYLLLFTLSITLRKNERNVIWRLAAADWAPPTMRVNWANLLHLFSILLETAQLCALILFYGLPTSTKGPLGILRDTAPRLLLFSGDDAGNGILVFAICLVALWVFTAAAPHVIKDEATRDNLGAW